MSLESSPDDNRDQLLETIGFLKEDLDSAIKLNRTLKISAIISMIACMIVCLSSSFFYIALNKSQDFDASLPHTSLMWIGMDTLLFDGPITENAYQNLEASLSTAIGHQVRQIGINSPGGDEHAAEKIASLLNMRGIELSIWPHGICGSSCVPLLLHTRKHQSLDDGEIIFHQGFVYRSDIVHGLLSSIGLASDTAPVLMDPWVAQFGTALPVYFHSCTLANPLRSSIGIAMSWKEIQAVLGGHPLKSCDEALKAYECKRSDAPPFCSTH